MSNKSQGMYWTFWAIIAFLFFSFFREVGKNYSIWLWLLASILSFLMSLRYWIKHDRDQKVIWEYKRKEVQSGSYTPSQFFSLLNNYSKDGWELLSYNETKDERSNYSFTIVLKRKIKQSSLIDIK